MKEMELAKITSKGQITLPITIRKILNLKDGDKVAFIEKNGQYVLANPVSLAIDNARNAFKGEAKRLNLKNEDDVVNLVKEVRNEIKKEMGE
jgi:AbrB family looped-hinge helix DNA binding protein